ncbi:MAG: hypothetical protein IIA54_00485 [Chloroflexi bacterium]|nr:hypothetical protein [Chloroflexota bacterium]
MSGLNTGILLGVLAVLAVLYLSGQRRIRHGYRRRRMLYLAEQRNIEAEVDEPEDDLTAPADEAEGETGKRTIDAVVS